MATQTISQVVAFPKVIAEIPQVQPTGVADGNRGARPIRSRIVHLSFIVFKQRRENKKRDNRNYIMLQGEILEWGPCHTR
jgi:hypothetical protein